MRKVICRYEQYKCECYSGTILIVKSRYLDDCYEKEVPSSGNATERLYIGGTAYNAPAVYVRVGTGAISGYVYAKENCLNPWTGEYLHKNSISSKLSVQKQSQHLSGTAPDGKGYLNNINDAQSILDAVHSGDAVYMGLNKSSNPVFRFDDITGTNVNVRYYGGAGIPTNYFYVKGTVYPTIVPYNPNFRPYFSLKY